MNRDAVRKVWTRVGTTQNYEVYNLRLGEKEVGSVTVDLRERGFRIGHDVRQGALSSGTRLFMGRGWRERLIEAAKTSLENTAA